MKISELSNLLGIPKATLRLYERNGVFTGKVNEKNGYRDYDVWSITFLLEFIKLRRLGFGINDSVKMLHDSTVEHMISQYDRMQSAISSDIQKKQMILRYLENQTRLMRFTSLNVGNFWYEHIPERLLCRNMKRVQIDYMITNEDEAMYLKYMDIIDISNAIMMIPLYKDDKSREEEQWFVALDSSLVSNKENYIQAGFELFPEHVSLCTVVDAGNLGGFSHELFEPLIEKLSTDGRKPAGKYMHGLLVSRTTKDSHMQRLIKAEVPIFNNSDSHFKAK